MKKISEELMKKVVAALRKEGLPTDNTMVEKVAFSALRMSMYQGNVPVSDEHVNLAVQIAVNMHKK